MPQDFWTVSNTFRGPQYPILSRALNINTGIYEGVYRRQDQQLSRGLPHSVLVLFFELLSMCVIWLLAISVVVISVVATILIRLFM